MAQEYKAKLNPFTGQLQLVPTNIVLAFKTGVVSQTNLPLTGNAKGDARIANDTGHLYVWSIEASSGLLTDWVDAGDIVDLNWSVISGKPSSSPANIDDAVTKRHTQGTDAGLDADGLNAITALEIQTRFEALEGDVSGVYDNDIAIGTDDGFVFILDSAIALEGVILAGNNDGGSDNAGFRWLNIDIPKGATITSAHIVLTAARDTAGEVTSVTINGEASDNPDTFSTFEDFIARPLCIASVPYIIPPFLDGETYNTPELKTIIQEIVNRTGWIAGNAIALFLKDNGSGSYCVRNICNMEDVPASSARLYIEYTYQRAIFTVLLKDKLDGIETGAVSLTTVKADIDIADALTKSHSQNTDTKLDEDGANEVSAAQAKAGYTHSGVVSGNPHNVTKTEVSLGNVDNKSEATIISDVKADIDIADAITKKHTQNTDTGTNGNFDIVGEVSIKVYSQNNEPTLGQDNRMAIWIDTDDSNRVYLLFRRGSGDQTAVELA